jgi:hypothetical protein
MLNLLKRKMKLYKSISTIVSKKLEKEDLSKIGILVIT